MKLHFAALIGIVAAPASAEAPDIPAKLTPDDEAAVFTAAGFKRIDGQWKACEDDVTASYTPGAIDFVGDVNGDGEPEAVTSEGTTYCYGFTGTGYSVVSRQADGSWKLMTGGTGMPRFLETKGTGGWPDIEVGGPGFCFPVERWNGTEYVLNRQEYEGKRCTPQD